MFILVGLVKKTRYKSKGGLTRHKETRHPDASVESLHKTSLDVIDGKQYEENGKR